MGLLSRMPRKGHAKATNPVSPRVAYLRAPADDVPLLESRGFHSGIARCDRLVGFFQWRHEARREGRVRGPGGGQGRFPLRRCLALGLLFAWDSYGFAFGEIGGE